MDEFATIAELFRPLAIHPAARGLLDDVAVLPGRPGHDLVLTKDAIVEGVHFLPGDPLDLVARKLLRVNLSDLAAKGAEPFAYLLACAWSPRCGEVERRAFADGLAQDQAEFGLTLLGGDTVSTPGPLTLSATLLGWAPEGRAPSRRGARAGDLLMVSGPIGDGWLGLKAARGELQALAEGAVAALAERYRLPRPRLDLREAVRASARASADVSDGLIADAGHLAEAGELALYIELETAPLSLEAALWVASQPDEAAARLCLVTGGDDYQLVCAVAPGAAEGFPGTAVGRFAEGSGVQVRYRGQPVEVGRAGWAHG